MSLPIYYYVLGTPLGLLGLFRWGCWLIRRIPAVLYRPISAAYRLPISIVVPVYQEDPAVFATAIKSWLANDVEEIILVIDSSDVVCREIASRYPVRVLVTDVPGKRDALRMGWNAARTELVALVDSDTVWAPDVAVEVCKPFADPRVGGVGTRQNVYGAKGFLSRITDMFLDHRYFDENASQSLLGQAVSCLSGRTAVYRRALLLEVEPEFMNETFWGVQCLSGDDKRLTTLILERGHLTFMQRSAEVWSTFPTTWRVFFRQRLRWARNTWRSDLRALSRPWVWRHKFLAYTMIDKAVSSFTLLVGPAFMIYSLIVQNWVFAGVLALWWQISRSAKLLPHLRRRPSSFFFVPGYVVVSWLMALIKLQALLTIRKQRWLTRQVAVEGGSVVRTGRPAGGAEPVTAEPVSAEPVAVPAVSAVVAVPAVPAVSVEGAASSAPAADALVSVGAPKAGNIRDRAAGRPGSGAAEAGGPVKKAGKPGRGGIRTTLVLLVVLVMVAAFAYLVYPGRTVVAAPKLVAAWQLAPAQESDDEGDSGSGSGSGSGRDNGSGSGRDNGSDDDQGSSDGEPGGGGKPSSGNDDEEDSTSSPKPSEPKPKPTESQQAPEPTPDPQAEAAQKAAKAREKQRAAQVKAQEQAARDAAEAARERAAAAAEAAADRARAQANAAKAWDARGRPARMVVVRDFAVDLIQGGRLIGQAARPGGPLTLAAMDRLVPADWLVETGDEARLGAVVTLTPGNTFDLGGVKTLRLTGGPAVTDASSIYTGSGRLTAHGITVTSVDPTTNKPMPPGPGRPFVVVARGGGMDATDATFSYLGTGVNDPEGRSGVQFNVGAGGVLERATFVGNTVGLRLARSQGVRLNGIAVRESVTDGLQLDGDLGTALTNIVAERNAGNGVVVKGDTADRTISGISTSGNGEYGLSVVGQRAPKIVGIRTASDENGGLRLNRSTNAVVTDFTATDQPIGVFTHVGSSGLVFERLRIDGGRRGVVFEKSTHGVQMKDSSIVGARSIGVSVGGRDVTLDRLTVEGSRTAVRIERGADGVTSSRLTISGGEDGFVANPGSKRVVLRDFVVEGTGNDAVRTASPGAEITRGRITGADTGFTAGAPATISDTLITQVEAGVRSRNGVTATIQRVSIAALSVGVDAVPGSALSLGDSRSSGLQALKGDVRLVGLNELSLPPLNVLGAIGVPLVMLAFVLEMLHSLRQRRFGRGRRLPPIVQAGA